MADGNATIHPFPGSGFTRAGDAAAKVVDFVTARIDARLGAGTTDRYAARIARQKAIADEIERALAEVARPPLDWPTREAMANWIIEYGAEQDIARAVHAARNEFSGLEPHLSAYAWALQEAANPHVHAERLRIHAAEHRRTARHFLRSLGEKLDHAERGSGSLTPETQVRESARLARGIGERLDAAADLMARATMLAGGK